MEGDLGVRDPGVRLAMGWLDPGDAGRPAVALLVARGDGRGDLDRAVAILVDLAVKDDEDGAGDVAEALVGLPVAADGGAGQVAGGDVALPLEVADELAPDGVRLLDAVPEAADDLGPSFGRGVATSATVPNGMVSRRAGR